MRNNYILATINPNKSTLYIYPNKSILNTNVNRVSVEIL